MTMGTWACPWLPDDIVVNILARLPAKSVGRCRCVSRAWAATLSSDDFQDLHRRLAIADRRRSPSVFFLHCSFKHGAQMHVWSSQDRPNGRSNTLLLGTENVNQDRPTTSKRSNALRLATLHCRGLVVLEDACTEVSYLCNPSTGKMPALPQGQERHGQRRWNDNVSSGYYASLGLGYDAHTKRHKVVRVYYRGCDPDGLPRYAWCEVYVVVAAAPVRAGRWQPISDKPPAWVRPHQPSVFAQGHVHWLARRKLNVNGPVENEMGVIVSFSLADHTFRTVAPPLGMGMAMESQSLSNHELTELDGHLCLFSCNVSHSSTYDIWLLQQQQLPEASVWNLCCRIDLTQVSPDINDRFVSCFLCPLAIINNGTHILLLRPAWAFAQHKYPRLCAYNLLTGDVEDIFCGSTMANEFIVFSIDAAVYEESIISFAG